MAMQEYCILLDCLVKNCILIINYKLYSFSYNQAFFLHYNIRAAVSRCDIFYIVPNKIDIKYILIKKKQCSS